MGLKGGADTLLDAGRLAEAAEFARAAIELSRRVGERRMGQCAQAQLVRAEDLDAQPEMAERELRSLWASLDETERRFSGWWVLGALMLAARDAATRHWAAAQSARFPTSHSYGLGRLRFLHDAIIASLRAAEFPEAADFADQLEQSLREGLTPLSALHVRAARAAASGDPQALATLRDDARGAGLNPLAAVVDSLAVAQ